MYLPSFLVTWLLQDCPAAAAIVGKTQGEEMMLEFGFSDLIYTQELH